MLHEFLSLTGSAILILFGSVTLIITGVLLIIFSQTDSAGTPRPKASLAGFACAVAAGILWALGNYGMLLMVDTLGAGRGFTLSQRALVVNALCGIYLLKDPKPNTRAA